MYVCVCVCVQLRTQLEEHSVYLGKGDRPGRCTVHPRCCQWVEEGGRGLMCVCMCVCEGLFKQYFLSTLVSVFFLYC